MKREVKERIIKGNQAAWKDQSWLRKWAWKVRERVGASTDLIISNWKASSMERQRIKTSSHNWKRRRCYFKAMRMSTVFKRGEKASWTRSLTAHEREGMAKT